MDDALIGTNLSHYRLISHLGSGGMGIVYLAQDVRLGRHVAVKLLSDSALKNPQALARFDQEARAASALNHPNICAVFDIGVDNGRAFLVMEHLEGETLRGRIDRQLPTLDEALDLAGQIADAPEAAHHKKLIHRDIKPANIFIISGKHVKLLDFGLAKRIDMDSGSEQTRTIQELTQSGTTVGTVAYMSTEQVRGEPLDQRSDVWSFGLVLYEMLTGLRAFSGATTPLVFDAILHRVPGAPSRINPAVPSGLDDIIARALEKDPARRYQTMAEVRADLRRVRDAGGRTVTAVVSGSTSVRAPRRRKSESDKVNAIQSVAVLPFVNSSNDPEADYLSDGITEGIINRLSRLRGLRVASRSAVVRHKGSTSDIKTRIAPISRDDSAGTDGRCRAFSRRSSIFRRPSNAIPGTRWPIPAWPTLCGLRPRPGSRRSRTLTTSGPAASARKPLMWRLPSRRARAARRRRTLPAIAAQSPATTFERSVRSRRGTRRGAPLMLLIAALT